MILGLRVGAEDRAAVEAAGGTPPSYLGCQGSGWRRDRNRVTRERKRSGWRWKKADRPGHSSVKERKRGWQMMSRLERAAGLGLCGRRK